MVSSGQFRGFAELRNRAISSPFAYQALFAAASPLSSPALAAFRTSTAPEMCSFSSEVSWSPALFP